MAFATTTELANYLKQGSLDAASATLALDLATGIVRNAVGQIITQTTATVVLHVTDPCDQWLDMPQRPVTAVSAVTIDAVAVTDYVRTPHALWRADGWIDGAQERAGEPIAVSVAHTYGYAAIPDDIKAAALFVAGQLYTNPELLQQVRIDDYSATRAESDTLLPVMLIQSLRAAYGTGVYVTGPR